MTEKEKKRLEQGSGPAGNLPEGQKQDPDAAPVGTKEWALGQEGQKETAQETISNQPGQNQPTAEKPLYDAEKDARYRELKDAYGENMANQTILLDSLEESRKKAIEENEKENKRSRSMRFIAGLGDTLSSVANLVGVGQNASNQKQVYNAPGLTKRLDQARKDREAEIDKMEDRLLQMRQNADKAKLAMKLGLTKYSAQREAAAQELAAKKAADEAKRAIDQGNLELKKGELEMKRKNAESAGSLNKAKEQTERSKQTYYYSRAAAAGGGSKGKDGGTIVDTGKGKGNDKDYVQISYPNPDNNGDIRITLRKDSLIETGRRNMSVLRNELAQAAGFSDWNDWIKVKNSRKRSDKARVEAMDAGQKSMMNDLSLSMTDDEIKNIIDKYGTMAPTFMRQIANVGEQEYLNRRKEEEEKPVPAAPAAPAATQQPAQPSADSVLQVPGLTTPGDTVYRPEIYNKYK